MTINQRCELKTQREEKLSNNLLDYFKFHGGIITAEKEFVPQVVEIFKPQHQLIENECRMPLNIFAIPWGHHRTILDRYESEPMKALFYAAKTLEHSWSRAPNIAAE